MFWDGTDSSRSRLVFITSEKRIMYGCFRKLRVLFWLVLAIRALMFGVYIRILGSKCTLHAFWPRVYEYYLLWAIWTPTDMRTI